MTSHVGNPAVQDADLRALLDLSRTASPDHPLVELLTAVVERAQTVLHCAAAELEILAPDGVRQHVASSGLPDGAARLADHGDLQHVAGETVAVRLPGEAAEPDQDGVALLGVPILVRGRGVGALYFADSGRRAGFDDADVRLAERVAAIAATFVERSRTATANARREQWYAGGAALAREIASGIHADSLRLVAGRVVEIADADRAAILEHAAEPGMLVVSAAAGDASQDLVGVTVDVGDSIIARVMATGKPADLDESARAELRRGLAVPEEAGSAIVVPLAGSGARRGVLVIGRGADRPPITPAETGMATMFAASIALALELAEGQDRREQVVLVGDRERIARDLHDHVIQRLYAIGLGMQSAGRTAPPDTSARLISLVDEIDETIKQIRSTIHQLTRPIVSSQASLRTGVEQLLEELEPVLGFRPRFAADGPLDLGVSDDLVADAIAVLREALTNIARHAEASGALVTVQVGPDELQLDIRDDGRGLGGSTRRSGLANLRVRAEQRGGSLTILSTPGEGTRLVWSARLEGR